MQKKIYPLKVVAVAATVMYLFWSAAMAYPAVNHFSTAAPPLSFVSKPAHQATQVDAINLKVTANVAQGATYYTIELSTTPDFSDTVLVHTSSQAGQRTMTFPRLQYATRYYARVKTDVSDYGRITQFVTKAEVPVEITSPTNTSTAIDPQVVTVTVNKIPLAKQYEIQASTSPDFSSLVLTRTLPPGNNLLIWRALERDTTYYLRARADISTQYGPVVSFTTAGVRPQRLWGLSTYGAAHDGGALYSFSLDSGTLTVHQPYVPEYEDNGAEHFTGSPFLTSSGDLALAAGVRATGEVNAKLFNINQGLRELEAPMHEGSIIQASTGDLYVVHDWVNMFRGGVIRKQQEGAFSLNEVIFRLRSDWHGINPRAALLERDGFLYESAPYGGYRQHGTLFRFDLNGQNFSVIHTFTGLDGANPEASLIDGGDGYIYGVTPNGGASGGGVVFRLLPDGSSFQKLIDLGGLWGEHPQDRLTLLGGRLYGTTSSGGAYGLGTLFSINTDGTDFQRLWSFESQSGSVPFAAVTPSSDGTLYGTTTQGGAQGLGTLFKIQPDGTGFTVLYDFTHTTGTLTNGALLLIDENLSPVPVQTAQRLAVNVHPNPFMTSFTASVPEKTNGPVRWEVRDMSGRLVDTQQTFGDVPVQLGEDLERGLYILQMISGDQITVRRIIKQ